MTTALVAAELVEACQKPGCPVCRASNQSLRRYLDKFFYTKVNDIDLRAKLRVSRGFCRQHAYLVLDANLADALGMSIIYQDVLKNLVAAWPQEGVLPPPDDLAQGRGRTSRRDALRDSLRQLGSRFQSYKVAVLQALGPQGPCMACQQQEMVQDTVLSALVDGLRARREPLLVALRQGDPICLPHLRLAVGLLSDQEPIDLLLEISRPKYQALHDELAEYVRKNDYRYLKDGFELEESDAWRRVVRLLNGERSAGQ